MNEAAFADYLNDKRQNGKMKYSKRTIARYIGVAKEYGNFSADELAKNVEFQERDARGHRMYSNGWARYQEFLAKNR